MKISDKILRITTFVSDACSKNGCYTNCQNNFINHNNSFTNRSSDAVPRLAGSHSRHLEMKFLKFDDHFWESSRGREIPSVAVVNIARNLSPEFGGFLFASSQIEIPKLQISTGYEYTLPQI